MEEQDLRIKATFKNREELEQAVARLKERGFLHDKISVLLPTEQSEESGTTQEVGEGAAVGALFGGALGWLASIATLAVPGLGAFVVAGPIVSLLSGAGAGGVIGALIAMGFSDTEAHEAERRSRAGEGLVVVHCNDERERWRAHQTLSECHPEHLAFISQAVRPSPARRKIEEATAHPSGMRTPPHEDIELEAWKIWDHEGRPSGHALDNWVQAEHRLRR